MPEMETSQNGIFVAGDPVIGSAMVIEAIRGGKRAAKAIDRYFNGIIELKCQRTKSTVILIAC